MHDRALSRFLDGAAKNFMGKRGRITLPQKDQAHRIHHRAHIGPMKVDMGNAPLVCFRWISSAAMELATTALLACSTRLRPSCNPWMQRRSVKSEVCGTMAKCKDPDCNEFVFSSS